MRLMILLQLQYELPILKSQDIEKIVIDEGVVKEQKEPILIYTTVEKNGA